MLLIICSISNGKSSSLVVTFDVVATSELVEPKITAIELCQIIDDNISNGGKFCPFLG